MSHVVAVGARERTRPLLCNLNALSNDKKACFDLLPQTAKIILLNSYRSLISQSSVTNKENLRMCHPHVINDIMICLFACF
jgi:hypothetical protein